MRSRQARRPSRQCGSSGAPFSERSTEYAGRGARAPNSAVVIAPHAAVEPGLLEDRLRELRPRAVAAGGDVVDAEREQRHPWHRFGEVHRVGRAAALVVHDRDLVAFRPESQHRPDEVVPDRPEEPRGADDPRPVARGRFPVQLRAAVGAERVRRVRLDVRLALRPVEDVVAREVDERQAERGDVLRAADVDGGRALRVVLGPVHVRPGRGVQDDLRAPDLGQREAHVPLLASQGRRLRAAARRAPARAARRRR